MSETVCYFNLCLSVLICGSNNKMLNETTDKHRWTQMKRSKGKDGVTSICVYPCASVVPIIEIRSDGAVENTPTDQGRNPLRAEQDGAGRHCAAAHGAVLRHQAQPVHGGGRPPPHPPP